MTNEEVNYWNMAKQVGKLLQEARPQWEPLYKKMLPDYTRLDAALGAIDAKLQKLTGQGSEGYTEEKDKAEIRTLDAAMPIVKGMKALYNDGGHPELKKMAKYTRSALDDMRGSVQVAALEELHAQALVFADDLADELVTTAKIKKLGDEIKLYKPLLGTPNEQIDAGSLLREDSVKYIGEMRKAFKGLDLRVPNLADDLPDLVKAYKKARQVVDAGHGPKDDGEKPA